MDLEVKKLEAEIEDSVTLKKFFYIHLAPDHLKRSSDNCLAWILLILHAVADQQHTRETAKNVSYCGNKFSQKRSNQITFTMKKIKDVLVKTMISTRITTITIQNIIIVITQIIIEVIVLLAIIIT